MVGPLELAANGLTAVAILLAGRNNVHTWWTGIVGCTLFGILFAQNRLYADVALQAFFVATSVAGWWKWVRGDHGEPLPITHASIANLAWTVPLGVVVAAVACGSGGSSVGGGSGARQAAASRTSEASRAKRIPGMATILV